jgi:hypothetical protein
MGQLVSVIEKPSSTPGIVRFETNRTLSGQGHDHFGSPSDAFGQRPTDELARRLFGTGKVESVHVFSNMVTVDLKGHDASGLSDVIRDLYQYWKPGVEPPSFDDLEPAEDTPAAASSDASGGGDTALSEAAKRVPAHLLERSRQARDRWKAKGG